MDAIYNIDLEHLKAVDVDAPLKNARGRVYFDCITPYSEAAVHARQAGDARTADIYEFLCEIACLIPKFDTPGLPFEPRIFKNMGRGVAYQELPPPDREALRVMARMMKNSIMAARLFDLSWILDRRDADAGRMAAENYLAAAQDLIAPSPEESPQGWLLAITLFKRAVAVSEKLGRDKPLFKTVESALIEAMRAAVEVHSVRTFRLLELAHSSYCGDPQELTDLAEAQAGARATARDFELSREFLEIAVLGHRRNGENEKEEECLRKIAETHVAEAALCGDEHARAEHLRSAVEAARRARFDRAIIKGLLQQLMDAQKSAARQMKTLTIDLGSFQSFEPAVLEFIKSSSFREAVGKLIAVHPFVDLGVLRESVKKSIVENHFSHIFRTVQMNQDGRPTVVRSPFVGATEKTANAEFERELFSSALFDWEFRARLYIEPSRRYIDQEFNPGISDLLFLTRNNPFVTPGHEAIIIWGVLAGFQGDWMVASALLIPQVEQMMRRALETNGVDASTFDRDGTQPAKMFGGIFALPETEQFFGESLCFELKGHLIEKTGYDLRNRIAHGLATDATMMSTGVVSLWWLVLNMLFCGTLPRVSPTS